MEIRVHQRIDRRWIKEMNADRLRRSPGLRIQPFFGLTVLVATAVYVVVKEPQEFAALVCTMLMSYGALLVLNMPVRIWLRSRPLLRMAKRDFEELFVFNSCGYLVRWRSKTVSVQWSELRKIDRGTFGVTFFEKKGSRFVSKRSFENQADLEQLWNFLKEDSTGLLCKE